MSLHKQFKMDEKKEREGITLSYGANTDGSIPSFRLLRRSPSNQRYAKSLATETAPYARMIALGTLDNMQSEHIFMRVFCLSVLIGWDNVQDTDGTPIPYNFDNAMKLFKELPELFAELSELSAKMSLFREDIEESDVKN